MVSLPDVLLSVVFSWLGAPADYARCACVNRQWRTSSKAAHPHQLVIGWQDSEGVPFRPSVLDVLSRGQLTELWRITLNCAVFGKHENKFHMRSIMTVMKCLPLQSCTFEGDRGHKFLPDSIRSVRDDFYSYRRPFWDDTAFKEPCFKSITSMHLAYLQLNNRITWFNKPPVRLQRLISLRFQTCSLTVRKSCLVLLSCFLH